MCGGTELHGAFRRWVPAALGVLGSVLFSSPSSAHLALLSVGRVCSPLPLPTSPAPLQETCWPHLLKATFLHQNLKLCVPPSRLADSMLPGGEHSRLKDGCDPALPI